MYLIVFQFPQFKDSRGNEVAVTSFNAQLNKSELSDKDSNLLEDYKTRGPVG